MTDLIARTDALIREPQYDARRDRPRPVGRRPWLAPSTSSERVRALRADGVIRGYHADIALEALGRRVQARIAVRDPPAVARAHRGLPRLGRRRCRRPSGVFVVSGGDDFLLHVAVPDTDALYAFVIDRLTERREVADVRTTVVYEHSAVRRCAPRFGLDDT